MPLGWLIAVDTYVSCPLVTPYMIQISRKEVFVIVVISFGLDRRASYRPNNVTWFALRKGSWVRESIIWSSLFIFISSV